MRREYLYATSVLASLVGGDLPAVAQQSTQVSIEEIVVTARRREENLMTVPMSIAVMTADEIKAAGVKDLNALSLYTPGLWAEYGSFGPSGTGRVLTFRGLSASSGLIFVNGAPYAGGTPSLGSLERVEVLVGPQSAYFGRSTFQGALNFVTSEPGNTFQGTVDVEFASFRTTDDSISLEGPIVPDKLTARVTMRHYSTDGEWRNNSDPNERLGAAENNSVMATIVGTPTDELKIKALLGFEEADSFIGSQVSMAGFTPEQPSNVQDLFCNLGGSFGAYWCGALPNADDAIAKNPTIASANSYITPEMRANLYGNPLNFPTLFDRSFKPEYGQRQFTYLAHLNIDYDLPSGWTLSSITALDKSKNQSVAPMQWRDARRTVNPFFPAAPRGIAVLPYMGFYFMGQGITYNTSQEFRVTSPQDQRLRGTIGLSWLQNRQPGGVTYGYQPSTFTNVGSQTRSVNKTPAVFGGAYYDLTDQLTLGVEARYQWDKISSQAKFPTPGNKLSDTFKSFSPRISLDYEYAPNSMAYAVFSRGYRPGGFNNALVGAGEVILAQFALGGGGIVFKQERLDNFEIGFKSTWFDGRLQTLFDAYIEHWRDGQVSETLNAQRPDGTVQVSTLTTNTGDVDLHGVEFVGTYAVTENFSVKANFNWQASKFKSFPSLLTIRITGSSDVTGNRFPNAPDVVWVVTPTYTDHLFGDWDWFGRLDWKHRGKYMVDDSNVAWLAPSDVIDAHIGIQTDSTTIEVYATNLTDNSDFVRASRGNFSMCCRGSSNVNAIHLGLPNKRSFGIKGRYMF